MFSPMKTDLDKPMGITDASIDEQGLEVAEKRLHELENNTAVLVPSEQVFEKLRERYKKHDAI